MKALEIQLSFELKRFDAQKESIETLFIGGGTPSTIEPELYTPLFKILQPYMKKNAEITSEANPNSATKKWLSGMFKLGVNRISFGTQSFNDEKLKILNRAHSSTQAKEAIQNAKDVGFENLSLDLIYATLGDTQELLQHDLNEAFKLPINHLSAYALTIEEGTPFQSKPEMAKERLELTSWLFESIENFGFKQYEISNFGIYQSEHNLGYWNYKDYIGLGSGAVGKLRNKRFYPTNDVDAYIDNPNNIQTEILSDEDMKIEKIFLGLRSCVGFQKEILNKHELKQVAILLKENKLSYKGNTYYNKDYLLSDEIALFISLI